MDFDNLKENFIEMIQDIYYAEHRILKALPQMIEAASYQELQQAFKKHLKETEVQVTRLEKIFEIMGETPKEKTCHAMRGLIKEGKEIIEKDDLTPALKDSLLILAAQKVEHYEIATYRGLCILVAHLGIALSEPSFKQIFNLLNETLAEETKTDLALGKLAEGTKTTKGIYDEAEKEIAACCE